MSEALQPYRTRPLVLLVDDYVDTLQALEAFLRERGFDVLTATDGGAALTVLLRRRAGLGRKSASARSRQCRGLHGAWHGGLFQQAGERCCRRPRSRPGFGAGQRGCT